MLENFLQKNNIYFTFVSFNIGLAGTLYKMDALYSLGEYLGFNYAFRQIKSQRTSASIMDDLGINDALRNSTQITEDIRNSCNYFELVLPDTLIKQSSSIQTIKEFIFSEIKPVINRDNRDLFIFFKRFYNRIGESNYNLLHTIDSIIKSDIIISPVAGFASGIHEYFAKINAPKIIVGNKLLPFYLSNIDGCQHNFFICKREKISILSA